MAMVEGAIYNATKKEEKEGSFKKASKKAAKSKKAPGPVGTKYFIAFFDLSAKLSKKAQISVEVPLGSQSVRGVTPLLTGHTDTVGSKKANKALARRDFASVLAMFKAAGFNLKKDVVDVSLGEIDPAVATGDGKRGTKSSCCDCCRLPIKRTSVIKRAPWEPFFLSSGAMPGKMDLGPRGPCLRANCSIKSARII